MDRTSWTRCEYYTCEFELIGQFNVCDQEWLEQGQILMPEIKLNRPIKVVVVEPEVEAVGLKMSKLVVVEAKVNRLLAVVGVVGVEDVVEVHRITAIPRTWLPLLTKPLPLLCRLLWPK